MKVSILGTLYDVQFRHVRPPKAQETKAITTCVVACEKFIAIEHAFCSAEDNFSRRAGRRISFDRLRTQHHKAFPEGHAGLLWAELHSILVPKVIPPPKPKVRITDEAKGMLIAEGFSVRQQRENARTAGRVMDDRLQSGSQAV